MSYIPLSTAQATNTDCIVKSPFYMLNNSDISIRIQSHGFYIQLKGNSSHTQFLIDFCKNRFKKIHQLCITYTYTERYSLPRNPEADKRNVAYTKSMETFKRQALHYPTVLCRKR